MGKKKQYLLLADDNEFFNIVNQIVKEANKFKTVIENYRKEINKSLDFSKRSGKNEFNNKYLFFIVDDFIKLIVFSNAASNLLNDLKSLNKTSEYIKLELNTENFAEYIINVQSPDFDDTKKYCRFVKGININLSASNEYTEFIMQNISEKEVNKELDKIRKVCFELGDVEKLFRQKFSDKLTYLFKTDDWRMTVNSNTKKKYTYEDIKSIVENKTLANHFNYRVFSLNDFSYLPAILFYSYINVTETFNECLERIIGLLTVRIKYEE